MPSLVYITRIQPLSAEQAQALEASGVHVKSFRPGEITADECVLVMTSDAVLAGLKLPGLEPFKGPGGARGTESWGAPPLADIKKHLGADAAIWNFIKAGRVREAAAVEATAPPGQRRSTSVVVPAPDSLGFVASQAGVRALAASQLSLPPGNGAPGSNNHAAVLGLPVPSPRKAAARQGQGAVFPAEQTRHSKEPDAADAEPAKRFWQPVAMIAALSIFSVVLLAGRPTILPSRDVPTVNSKNPGLRSNFGDAASIQSGSKVRPSTNASNLAAEGQRRIPDDDFVAEDYTTHFDLDARPEAGTQAPDRSHETPNRPVRKRVVVD